VSGIGVVSGIMLNQNVTRRREPGRRLNVRFAHSHLNALPMANEGSASSVFGMELWHKADIISTVGVRPRNTPVCFRRSLIEGRI
jgi:hypothetical protein